jgi:hypothetical protein
MGVAASRAWVTKPAGNLTDAKEEGDADMRRSLMAHFAPLSQLHAICLEKIRSGRGQTNPLIHTTRAEAFGEILNKFFRTQGHSPQTDQNQLSHIGRRIAMQLMCHLHAHALGLLSQSDWVIVFQCSL